MADNAPSIPNAAPTGDDPGTTALDLNKYTVLSSKVSAGKRLTLYTDKAKTTAWLWIQPTSPFFELTYHEIEHAVSDCKLSVSTEAMLKVNAVLDKLREQQQSGKFDPEAFKPLEVAHGKPAKDGDDGRLEWFISEPDPERLRFQPDAQGRIDYREMNTVVNVNRDSPLVKVHEPTKGEPGYDVFGHAIAAKNGEPVKLIKGKGVYVDEDTGVLHAEIDGHVSHEGGSIEVSPVFVVEKDVDFSVGNINFRGKVEVRRDVCEGFTVRATDGVVVQGMVTQGIIFCDKDVEIRGGLTATSGRGFVETKGRLLAKYMVNAKVDVFGDILCDTQIVNCEISCSGKVYLPTGKLLGGTTIALGGLDVGEIGAELGTKTTIIVSIENFATAETRAIDMELSEAEKKLAKIEGMLGPYLRDRGLLNELPPAKMEQIFAQIQEYEAAQAEVGRLEDERREALLPYADAISDEIIVHRGVHPGVDVKIDNTRQIFSEYVQGPFKLKPNYTRGTIAIHPI